MYLSSLDLLRLIESSWIVFPPWERSSGAMSYANSFNGFKIYWLRVRPLLGKNLVFLG